MKLKKLLALLMAAVLVLGLLPMAVLADPVATGYLADLRVEDTNGTVSYLADFDSETKEYTVTVPSTETKVAIGAKLSDNAPDGSKITLKYVQTTGDSVERELEPSDNGGDIIKKFIAANTTGASFTVEVGVAGNIQTYSVTINRSTPPAEPNPVIITQPVAETTCNKDEVVTLSVAADETLGQNLSYQWYRNVATGVMNMMKIDGATEKRIQYRPIMLTSTNISAR